MGEGEALAGGVPLTRAAEGVSGTTRAWASAGLAGGPLGPAALAFGGVATAGLGVERAFQSVPGLGGLAAGVLATLEAWAIGGPWVALLSAEVPSAAADWEALAGGG